MTFYGPPTPELREVLRYTYFWYKLKQWIEFFALSYWLLKLEISIHLQAPNDAKLTRVMSKMASRFVAVTNEEISRILIEARSEPAEKKD